MSLPTRRAAVLALAVVALASGASTQDSQFALRFYGTGVNQQDRVRIPIDDDAPGPDASAPCDVGAGGFTVELWVRGLLADNATANGGGDVETFDIGWIDGNIIVDRDIFGGSERKWGISLAGGFVRFGTSAGDGVTPDVDSTIEGDTQVLDGTWHHIACVRDAVSGAKHIYVDGVLDYSGLPGISTVDISYPDDGAPGAITPWGPFIVLAAEKHDAGPAFPSFDGFMDEVRVWDVARSAVDIAASYDVVLPAGTPGLVGQYRFEEGFGTTVSDTSGAGSPDGDLIAGVAGNGEWVAWATDPANTAPVTGGAALVTLDVDTYPSGIPITVNGTTLATPWTQSVLPGSTYQIGAASSGNVASTTWSWEAWSHGAAQTDAFTVPAGGAVLRAIYAPATGGGQASVSVPAADRNADYYPSVGQAFGNLFDPLGLCCGNDGGGPYETGVQFALPIPNGAAVLSATLEVTATSDQQGSPVSTVRAYDVDDAPAFVSGSPTPVTSHAATTSASVSWPFPAFSPGQSYTSPDLSSLVQEVVDRSGWTAGNRLGLVLDPAGTTGDQWRCIDNFASGNPPTLTVSWGSAGSGGDFVVLGTGLGGASGVPTFDGAGDLTPGSADGFAIYSLRGPPAAPTFFFLGASEGAVPFKGGTIYVVPWVAIVPLFGPDASGTIWIPLSFDNTIPSGLSLVMQLWFQDATGPFGFTATPGLRLDVP